MKRILIIEDNEETLNNLKTEFENSGIETICCSDFDSSEKALNDNVPFDAVILDWYFVLENSSELSKKILGKLKLKYFIPVFIYTGHSEDAENKNESDLGYPKNMINIYDKTITCAELKQKIDEKLESNLAYIISIKYRENIYSNLEKIFFELNDTGSSSLGKVLKTIYGNGDNIDWNNDIIITLLHRSLVSDDEFTNNIKEILKTAENNNNSDSDFNRKLINKVVYHHGKSDYIRNGDIVKIYNSDNSIIDYGIVITPDCDIENNKTRFLELIELKKLDDINSMLQENKRLNIKSCFNHGSFFSFPAIKIKDVLVDFVAVLKSRFIIKETEIGENTAYPESSKRLLYSQKFLLNENEVTLELICSKVNPYKAEFLQKLHTHNSRVGIPDIKELL
jgi:CheY-like chemotaxis protein